MFGNPPGIGNVDRPITLLDCFQVLPVLTPRPKGRGSQGRSPRRHLHAGASTFGGFAGKAAIKVHKPKLTVIAGIEGLDDLMDELAAEFEGMAAAGPSDRIFRLPHLVIEALQCSPLIRSY